MKMKKTAKMKEQDTEQATAFLFVGHQLWLDWINTEIVANGERVSLIADYADLRAWLLASGAWQETELARLERQEEAEESAEEGKPVKESAAEKEKAGRGATGRDDLTRLALAWRGRLRRLAEAMASGQTLDPDAVAEINRWLATRSGAAVLEPTAQGWTATTRYVYSGLDGLLAPVAASLADLLTHGDLTRVHKCENPECVLFYYDASRSRTRHWCRMDACGNRHKAAAHYARQKTKNAGAKFQC